ncbi:MAG: TlpA family protein disulfide reductase [Ectothiorhodospiraceae bacterium]|nr:TlpA family protein disulfide reductase [Ectothiorhodospiraceae bacterium]
MTMVLVPIGVQAGVTILLLMSLLPGLVIGGESEKAGERLQATTILRADTFTPPKGVLTVKQRRAPALILPDIDGDPFDLAALKGQWVFVHFWASWCGPCRREIPAIQRMVEKFPEGRLGMAIVNTAEDEDTVFTFLGVLAPDLLPLMDHDGQATERWKPRGLPSTYLVDPSGMIRYQVLGGQAWDEDAYMTFLLGITEKR